MLRFVLKGITIVLILGILLISSLWLKSVSIGDLTPKFGPTTDYPEAVKRFDALQAKDALGINRVCHSQLLSHGEKVAHVIILLHGYTNCPQQLRQLGETFYERGFNVLIPRMPHHGLADRMTTDQANLTAEEMINYTGNLIDMAHGFGDDVTVLGFSAGGVMTAWAAQYRSDVDLAVLISPAFGVNIVPSTLTKPFVNLLLTLPNFFRWWDPEKKLSVSLRLEPSSRMALVRSSLASRLSSAESLSIVTPSSNPSRTLIMVTPCRPISLLRMTISPGRACRGAMLTSSGIRPSYTEDTENA